MSADMKLLFQEFKKINQDKTNYYEGQAQLDFPKGEENPLEILVTLTPKYGYFRGGIIQFQCILPKNYPNEKPVFKCLTKVFHPNIS
jgi:ubiquitin-protein ligase